MKKKLLSLLLVTGIFSIVSISRSVNAQEDSNNLKFDYSFTNIITGKSLDIHPKILKLNTQPARANMLSSINSLNPNNYNAEVELEYPLPNNNNNNKMTTLSTGDNETNETGVVRVLARINYDISGSDIRVNSGSSRFTILNSSAYVSNRVLRIQQGFNNAASYVPNTNSLYTKYTNWGFVHNYGGAATAKVVVEGTVGISGMSSYRVSSTVYR